MTKEQNEQFWRDKAVELDQQAEKFLSTHPQDGRRWEVMLRSIQMARWRVYSEETTRAAAEARDLVRLQQIISAPDSRGDIAEQARALFIQNSLEAARTAFHAGNKPDLGKLAELLDNFATIAPASRSRSNLERIYLGLLGEAAPDEVEARLHKLAGDTANLDVASMAAALIDKNGFHGKPIEMKFTAADGQAIDLANLRGKVVLVDFWATWCGPCMNEMPNVKAVYAKYHSQGFEVIGVSLDGGGITKGIQSGVKAREQFLAFLEREQMPWPQHYDNLGWKNEFAQKFKIKSIPAVFLIGRDGRVISTEARGESLEPQVRKALGL
ncbi:MAG TPA: TlpA disulfide reductase family protein [Opitutaceae bacterium]|nr:TlpA disulfide reductase family protein [Opitutaceae bacterium]